MAINITETPPPSAATDAAFPPNWGTGDPNEWWGPNIIICAVITLVLAAVFVAARFYTRWSIRRVLGLEDWMILVALGFSVANTGGMIEQARLGFGKHIWFVKDENLPQLMKHGLLTILWYVLSLAATKISILLLYLRILTYDWARKATYALLVVVVLANVVYSVAVTLTACIPIEAWWDLTITEKRCHTQEFWWANTGMHLITDFLIFLLPLPMIFTLQSVKTRQRLLLYGIFTFGFFICAISIVRFETLLRLANHIDATYDNITISYWSCIEVNSAIICSCQMTLKPLASKFFPRLLDDRPPRGQVQHASASIGGRVFNFRRSKRTNQGGGTNNNAARGDGTDMEQTAVNNGHSRPSWLKGGAGIRLDSDAPIVDEDVDVTLNDLESQKGEPSTKASAAPTHVRGVDSKSNHSTE